MPLPPKFAYAILLGRKIMLYQQYIEASFFFSTGVKIDLLKILVIDEKKACILKDKKKESQNTSVIYQLELVCTHAKYIGDYTLPSEVSRLPKGKINA